MGDKINKEFEKYQEELKIREKKLKPIFRFEPDEEVEKILEELKNKKVVL